ncbi:MAG: DEAD/DEAH box helicase [Myxococcales bacterium]|nr:DEAD/DEAH box helicase [Myxococcales bacterium]
MTQTFADFDLIPSLQATLTERELVTTTEIQARVIPALLAGRSVVGVSPTGSGKTLAYVLPMLDALKRLEEAGDAVAHSGRPRAVVVVPGRDLGEQVARVFKLFTHTTRLRVRPILGGTKLEVARNNASGPFEVLVATPGRLVKMLDESNIYLGDVRLLVFDETDQMFDQSFLPAAQRIVAACPPKRQLALFSATVPPAVQTLIAQLFKGAEVIRSGGAHQVVPTLLTSNRLVAGGDRSPLLSRVLQEKVEGSTLFFTNTREQCDALAAELTDRGYPCAIYRGEMEKQDRRANLTAFRAGEVKFLVSTDLGSRGLDIENVDRVVNYHLPNQTENYLHRVGRTARAGRAGLVINFVTERDKPLIALVTSRGPVKTGAGGSPAARNEAKEGGARPPSGKRSRAEATAATDRPRVRPGKGADVKAKSRSAAADVARPKAAPPTEPKVRKAPRRAKTTRAASPSGRKPRSR